MLLFFSTAAVGVGYLGLAAAPTLAVACAASVLGGAGNGVQWVAVVSAVQELTAQLMQARVISVLESIGAAMPGVGYLIGGLVGTGHHARTVFLVAGIGVLAVVAVAAPLLRGGWTKGGPTGRWVDLSDENEVIVQLRPRGPAGPEGMEA